MVNCDIRSWTVSGLENNFTLSESVIKCLLRTGWNGSSWKKVTLHGQNYTQAVFPMREGAMHTWKQNYDVVSAVGHSWCPILRDTWTCVGETYAEVLRNTSLYNTTFSFQKLKPGTFVFADGNSFLAQVMISVVCWGSGNTAEAWIGTVLPEQDPSESRNFLLHVPDVDATMLLISNDKRVQRDPSYEFIITYLQNLPRLPDVIVLGLINFAEPQLGRARLFAEHFPTSKIVHRFHAVGGGCLADFQNCGNLGGYGGHVPGLVLLSAENLMQEIMGADYV